MAFYYVKNGGTAVGDAGRYASQQTGSFAGIGAAGYYDNIAAAIAATTPPIAGDFINPSDLHSHSQGTNITYTGLVGNPFYIVAVDDTNIDAARTTGNMATETLTSNADFNFSNIFASGVSFVAPDQITFSGNNTLRDGTLTSNGPNNSITINNDDSSLVMENHQVAINNTGTEFNVGSGGLVVMRNCAVTTTSTIAALFSGNAGQGGLSIDISGTDLSGVTGTLFSAIAGTVNNDTVNIEVDLCELATGVLLTDTDFVQQNKKLLVRRSSAASAAAEYQYHYTSIGGSIDDDSAIFRNESPVFTDSNQKVSYQIVTNSDASVGSPLVFDMPLNKWSVLSSASTDTLRFYITSNTALTDKDIFIKMSYPDGTNKQTPNCASSAPVTVGGTLDLMATGTALATDGSSTWTGGLSNLYQIDVDTSGNAGADTYPIIKVYTTIPSVTIQLAMDFTPL